MADLPRTVAQWRDMVPEAVVAGSYAQVVQCITDARFTILTLTDEAARLRVALDDIARRCEAVGLDTLVRIAREALAP